MKNIIPYVLLFILFNSCSNDDDTLDCQGIDCLPPITQTGAGTFGCLVDGEPFVAFGGVTCFYQLIDGEYFFAVGFSKESGFPRSISIQSDQKEIMLGENDLVIREPGNIYGQVRFGDFVSYATDQQNNGVLTITKFDEQNQIVSGIFEFEILNADDGRVYQITNGRFDAIYSR